MSDYVKLTKEMRLVLHQLTHLGVIQSIACGILIEGMSEIDTDDQHNKIFVLFTGIKMRNIYNGYVL